MTIECSRKFIGKSAEPEAVPDDEPIPLPIVVVEMTIDEWDKASALELFGVLQ